MTESDETLARQVAALAQLPPEQQLQQIAQVVARYDQLDPDDERRVAWLTVLAASPVDEAVRAAVNLVCSNPPARSRDLAKALVPWFREEKLDPRLLFPGLLAALGSPATAPVVLDLANYLVHRGRVSEHPCQPRIDHLTALFRQLVEGLRRLEEGAEREAVSADALRDRVSEGISLFISLAHALALMGDRKAVPALTQGLDVAHRRLQTEAAAALAGLGEATGLERLAELAEQPATRSRALQYLSELDALDRAAPETRTPAALAEGELAQWLADPLHFGVAPTRIWLIESRRWHWPGFDEPQDCFLLGFEYVLSRGTLSGVGMGGPLTLALPGLWDDLEMLDLWGYFAGWQAEHDEIRQWTAGDDPRQWPRWQAELADRLAAAEVDLDQVELQLVGQFFGSLVLLASATHQGQPGILVVDPDSLRWWNSRPEMRAFQAAEAYAIYKGRAILETFNPPTSP